MTNKKRAVIFLCSFAAFSVFAGCVAALYFIDMPKQTAVEKQESGIKYYSADKTIKIGAASERYIFMFVFNCKEENCRIVCSSKEGANAENTKEAFWKIFGVTPDVTADFKNDRLIAEITKIGGFFADGEYYTGVEVVNALNETAYSRQDYERLCAIMGEFIKKETERISGYLFECSDASRPWLEDNRDTILAAIQTPSYEYIKNPVVTEN